VDGAGISLFFASDRRLPLGASDPDTAEAERLQFTVGEGPCLTSYVTGEPVLADEATMRNAAIRRECLPSADSATGGRPIGSSAISG
jgi:hypothetical protein